MTREEHDKAILAALNIDLDNMGLVDEEKVDDAREAIVQTVTTLLDCLAAANGNGVGGKTASEILLSEANASYSRLLTDRDSEIERLKWALEAKAPNIEMIAKAIAANHGWDGDNSLIKWRDFEGDARAACSILAASKAEAAEQRGNDLEGGDDERT